MKRTSKFIILPFIFVLAILAVFTISQPVHAQDELPPTEPVVEPAPVGSDPAPVEVPPESGVALLTEADAPIALDSTEAAALPANLDPWFKVGTSQYNFLYTGGDCTGLSNCTISATPLQDAVNYISAHGTIPSDGFIHVDAGTIPNQKVVVDGNLTYENYIKGIVGHVNTSTKMPDANLSFTDGTSGSYIRILNKLNGFTLSGLNISGNTNGLGYWGVVRTDTVTGAVLLQDLVIHDANTNAPGINIYITNGLVTLKNVDSSGNAGSGAHIDNSAGTAGVTITNSVFDDNQLSTGGYEATGLYIKTKGAVLLTNVSASRNLGSSFAGLWIDNTTGIAGVIINRGIFDENNTTGLYVRTKGAILLTNIESSQNDLVAGSYGADLDNTGGVYGVTINHGRFDHNFTTGLHVHTKGSILLSDVASTYNISAGGSSGAELNNALGTGNVTITNLPSTDTFMQPGFDWNHDQGVDIFTNGVITLTNVNAQWNEEDGIRVLQATNKGATLTNCRVDYNDWGAGGTFAGIHINSLGPIVINGGHANSNFLAYGVAADNHTVPAATPKTVTISYFTANSNATYGIFVESKGAIKLTSVTVNSTTGGASTAIHLDNTFSTALTPPGITLSKVMACDNDVNGIILLSRGILSLTSIIATDNGYYGAYITQFSTPPAYPVTTITTGNFSNNGSWGLTIYGRGTITLKDITSDHNTNGNGAYITNASGNVSLLASSTGGNSFSYNHGTHDGLDIDTQGAVTLNKVTASGNTGATGVYLYFWNGGYAPVGNVIINGGTFSNNAQGLIVLSKGTINVSNVAAILNSNVGITLNNTYDHTGTKGITVAKADLTTNGTGLDADSYGLITLNTVHAYANDTNGVDLNNNYTATIYLNKGVTVLSSYGLNNFSNNGGLGTYSGLYIRSRGSISIAGVIADFNTNRGIDLDEGGIVPQVGKITLTNITTRNNGYSGIYIKTLLAVTGSYLTSNYNGYTSDWDGLTIYGQSSGSAITISNSVFMENGWGGLWCSGCTGAFTLINVVAVGNGGPNISH